MADGAFRFHHGAGQQFYPNFGNRASGRNQARTPPPAHPPPPPLGLRLPFDVDSPSRTPNPPSPSLPALNMYNTSQHLLNNGGQRGFGGMPLGMPKPFSHQNHQGQQQHQHQDPSSHNHGNSYAHHQHSHSSGMGNGQGHFGSANHMQNGGQGLGGFGVVSKHHSEHWNAQLQLAQQARDWSSNKVTHAYARIAQGSSKDLVTTTASLLASDLDKEKRQRPGNDDPAARSKNQSWTELDLGGQMIRNVSFSIFKYKFLTKLYFNNNKLSMVPKDIGQLRALKTLDLSVNELHSVPPQVGMLVNLKELLLFDNKIRTLPFEIGNLYQCAMLGVEGNPLNEDLKQVVVEQGSLELIKYLRENGPAPEPPNDRDWIVLDESHIADEDKLTLVNYNTLCQHYCNPALYGYTPANALSWEHRREVIMDELRNRNADIMCLQEVEHDAFENYFRPKLAHMDYKGIFWPKGRAKTMGPNEAKAVDGCATFYKSSKYILLDKQLIDLASTAINRPDMKGEADIYNRVMPKDNVAVVTFFENRMSGARLIVTNAHLHWDQEYKDVKVVQVAVLLEVIARLAQTYTAWPALRDKDKQLFRFSNGDAPDGEEVKEVEVAQPKPSLSYSDPLSIPLILCGDFNSLPNSGPIELIRNGVLSPHHSDLEGRRYGKFTRDGMEHPFAFKSSYSEVGEMRFTNYVSNFEGVVDYIWYARNSLSIRGLLGQVDPEYIARVPGFPNVHFPSDHLALFAEFGIKSRRAVAAAGGNASGSAADAGKEK